MAAQITSGTAGTSKFVDKLKSPRSQKFGIWLVGFFLFFGLFGHFVAPPLLKAVLLKQLSQELHREVSIERININPFALTVSLNGLSIKTLAGGEQAGFDELFVNLSSASIFRTAVVVDEVRVQGLRLAVARVAEGRYDISDLLDAWLKPSDEPPGALPRFSLNNIQLLGGKIEFDDQPKGRQHRINQFNLALPFISSLPYQTQILVEPNFSAVINEAPLVLKGRSKPFAERHESELDLDLDGLDLAAFQPYLPDSLPLRLVAGTLDSEMKIVFRELSERLFSLSVVGSAHVSGLTVIESSGLPLMACKRLDVDLDNADLVNQTLAIKRVVLDGLDFTLSVNRAGEFNVLNVIDRLTRASAPEAGKDPAAKALAWSLGEFVLSNGLIRWKDDSNLTPVVGEVRELNAKIGKVDSKLVDPIEIIEASYQVDLGDRFRVAKSLARGIRIDLPAHRVDIAEASNQHMRARMSRNADGKIEWVSSPILKTIRAADKQAQDDRPWTGTVEKLAIEDLAFRFEDQSVRPTAIQDLENFNLTGQNLSNEPGQKGTIALSSTVNKKGSLKVAG